MKDISKVNNYVQLVGKSVFDVRTFTTSTNKVLANIVLKVNNTRGNGYKQFEVIAWNELAEQVGKDVKKNTSIKVIGELNINRYTNKQNQEVTTYQVVANEITIDKGDEVETSFETQETSFEDFATSGLVDNDDSLPF